jgi:UV excision repair protein RAD23
MKLNFWTVQGKVYELEVEDDMTIGDIKWLLEEQHGLPGGNMKLILSGKVLDDATIVSSLHVSQGTYIVVHCAPVRRQSAQKAAPAPPPVAPTRQHPAATEPTPRPRSPSAGVFQPSAGSGSTDPGNFQGLVATLTELGFEKSLCEQARPVSNSKVDATGNLLLSRTLESGGGGHAGGGAGYGAGGV